MSDVAAEVIHQIAIELGMMDAEVEAQHRLLEDLGADSLNVMDAVIGIEESLGAEIQNGLRLDTVQDVIDAAASAVARKASRGTPERRKRVGVLDARVDHVEQRIGVLESRVGDVERALVPGDPI